MAVLILRQQGPDVLSETAVDEVEKHPGLKILDRSAKMLRVEGNQLDLQGIAARYPGLQVSEERSYTQIRPNRSMAQKAPDEKGGDG